MNRSYFVTKTVSNSQALVVSSLGIENIVLQSPTNYPTYSLTLPTSTGSAGQVLSTNGNGVLSWVTGGGGTVTNVSASVPAWLSVSVTNPTTTPNIVITGTSTGSGTVTVLQTSPTIKNYLAVDVDFATIPGQQTLFELTNNENTAAGVGILFQKLSASSTIQTYFDPSDPTQNTLLFTINSKSLRYNGATNFGFPLSNGSSGQILSSTGGGAQGTQWINLPTSVSSVTASSPINSSGGTTPNITLSTVPTSLGGTGLTTIGSINQVLTSNGLNLYWANPTTGTVTSVTASSPVNSSGGATPNISLSTIPISLGGTGLTSVGSNGQVLQSNGSGLSYVTLPTPVTSVSGSSPITSSGGATPTISLSTVPTTLGGTGLTTVGTNGQVLTSNGTTLSWQTPSAPGVGTVTSVSASVPSWLNVTVTNSTSTPNIAITGTATGTGTTTVLSDSPTISTLLTVNGEISVARNNANGEGISVYNTYNTFPTTSYIAVGRNNNALNHVHYGFQLFGNNSASNNAYIYFNGNYINFYSNGEVSIPSLTLTTALSTINGGTGLTSIGTSGQVLTSNGTSLYWNTPTVGTVTSVSATSPLASSGGTTPTISISSSSGSGAVLLQNYPTVTGGLSLSQTSPSNANIGATYTNSTQSYALGLRGDTSNMFALTDITSSQFRLAVNTAGQVMIGTTTMVGGAATTLEVFGRIRSKAHTGYGDVGCLELQTGGYTSYTFQNNAILQTDIYDNGTRYIKVNGSATAFNEILSLYAPNNTFRTYLSLGKSATQYNGGFIAYDSYAADAYWVFSHYGWNAFTFSIAGVLSIPDTGKFSIGTRAAVVCSSSAGYYEFNLPTSAGTAGQYLISGGPGGQMYWGAGGGGGGGTVNSVTASAPLASSGGTAPNISIASSTGSGAVVLANSPYILTYLNVTKTATEGYTNIASFLNPNNTFRTYIDIGKAAVLNQGGFIAYDTAATYGNWTLAHHGAATASWSFSNSSTQGLIEIYKPGTTVDVLQRFAHDSANYYIGIQGGGNDFRIYDAITSQFVVTLKQNGYVGIGTTNPAVKLDVNGTMMSTDLRTSGYENWNYASAYTLLPELVMIYDGDNKFYRMGPSFGLPPGRTYPNVTFTTRVAEAVRIGAIITVVVELRYSYTVGLFPNYNGMRIAVRPGGLNMMVSKTMQTCNSAGYPNYVNATNGLNLGIDYIMANAENAHTGAVEGIFILYERTNHNRLQYAASDQGGQWLALTMTYISQQSTGI